MLEKIKIKYKNYSGYFISLVHEFATGHTLKMTDNTGNIIILRYVNPKDIVWE